MKFLDMFTYHELEYDTCENKFVISNEIQILSELWVTFPPMTRMEGAVSLDAGNIFSLFRICFWSIEELRERNCVLKNKKPTIVFEEDGCFSINMLAPTDFFPVYAMYDSVLQLKLPSPCRVKLCGYKIKYIFHRYLWNITPHRKDYSWWRIQYVTFLSKWTVWDTKEYQYNVVGYCFYVNKNDLSKIKHIRAEIVMNAGSSKQYTVCLNVDEYDESLGRFMIRYPFVPRVSTCRLECMYVDPLFSLDIGLYRISDCRLLVGDGLVNLGRHV